MPFPFVIIAAVILFAIIGGLISEGWSRKSFITLITLIFLFVCDCTWMIYAVCNHPYELKNQIVNMVDRIAIIKEGDNLINLSKITGESYSSNDVVQYKKYSSFSCGIWFGDSKITDVKVIGDSNVNQ